MRSKVKHIVKILMMFFLIICWAMSIGYTNRIKPSSKTANFYIQDQGTSFSVLDEIKKQRENLPILGWSEKEFQEITNADLNKNIKDAKVMIVQGKLSLMEEFTNLLEDDIEGCTINEDTAYDLFGNSNIIGKTVRYKERELVIRGIHKSIDVDLIANNDKKEEINLNGFTVDSSELTIAKLEQLKDQNGINAIIIGGDIYYNMARFITLIFPLAVLIALVLKVVKRMIKTRRKPVQFLVWSILAIGLVIIFLKIINFKFQIPLDMIPNKWSNFEFWNKLIKENIEKYQYFISMKKYGFNIYNMNNLIPVIIYSMITVAIFFINCKFIKIKSFNQWMAYIISIPVIVFFTVIIGNLKGLDVNMAMLWVIYPIYLLGEYILQDGRSNLNG